MEQELDPETRKPIGDPIPVDFPDGLAYANNQSGISNGSFSVNGRAEFQIKESVSLI
jgi:hypothetical protein